MDLGKLESLDPTNVWAHEAHSFTPWLLENKDYLADALGIEMELEATEHRVGSFSLDLVGRDLTNNGRMIVENQLTGTDHTHLGQLVTYAAGTGAITIVWIATEFREEHRQAIDWLNEHTDEDTRFFGVKLEVLRIGDSLPAPLFNVVAEPNDWQKQVRASASSSKATGKAAMYVEFWEKYLERVKSDHPDWTRARRPSTQNWFSQPSPIRGASIVTVFAAKGRLRHELYIDSGDEERNMEIFEALKSQRESLESAYGRTLDFQELPDARASRIADHDSGDVADAESHDRFIEWFLDAGRRLRAALQSIDLARFEKS